MEELERNVSEREANYQKYLDDVVPVSKFINGGFEEIDKIKNDVKEEEENES